MALSPQDRAFYKEKLGWKALIYLLVATIIMGSVIWPLMLFLLDWSAGQGGKWTLAIAWNMAIANFPLALVVSAIMWSIAQFYLYMGWLPSRR